MGRNGQHLICKNENRLYLGGRIVAGAPAKTVLKCLFGGIAYGLVEILWRGYTHPSMVITGGLCFVMICGINEKFSRKPLFVRSAACTLAVTCAEFCVGMLVNHVLNMEVWDYSDRWLHLFGQICPMYMGLWFALCMALSFLLPKLHFSVISSNLRK